MDLLFETLAFAAKGFVVFLTIAVTVGVVAAIVRRRSGRARFGARLEVKPLNRRFQALGDSLRSVLLDPKALKALGKERKQEKAAPPADKKNVFVLDFEGDVMASAVTSLREEISAITAVARPQDEVVVRLESPGGAVSHYGLAAAQLQRLKDKKVKLTVCVDRVAASGGYMMACVADRIVAAPFAVVGSIGVVAQVPNVHRLLKKYDVDFEELTAGEFKRTVSVFGEITEKGRAKFTEQLEQTHTLFKDFVKAQRPALDLGQVATGEYWLARQGLELGLVDQLATSDEYLLSRADEANLLQVQFRPDEAWRQRFGRFAAEAVERAALSLFTRLQLLTLR
jgi:serine protease SohB